MKTETTMTIDKQTGANLKSLRRAAGMTQSNLGAALKITFQQVQKYEKGSNRISLSAAASMCNAIGCDMSDLLAGVKINGKTDAPLSTDEMKLVKLFRSVKSPRVKQTFFGLVKELGNG